MVGVPSSRSCDACRAQRKKCDRLTPPCSRCERLKINCVGIGQHRFKFVEGKHQSRGRDSSSSTSEEPQESGLILHHTQPKKAKRVWNPTQPLSNDFTIFTSSFIRTIDPTKSFQYQLPLSFGDFLLDIPCRLGTNEALDAASDALDKAYRRYCSGMPTKLDVLAAYGHAIKALRMCLDDSVKARSSETLAAIMVLQIFQVFNYDDFGGGHSAGAAGILKNRGFTGPTNDFERKVLLSLRGPLIVEALYDPKINFTRKEWLDLSNVNTSGHPAEDVMYCLAQVPHLMARIEEAKAWPNQDSEILKCMLDEAMLLRNTFKPALEELRKGYERFASETDDSTFIARVHFTRIYTFAMAVGIAINCILENLLEDPTEIRDESSEFSRKIIIMAEANRPFRPLGALSVLMCLIVALVTAPDEASRKQIEKLHLDFKSDISKDEGTTAKCLFMQKLRGNSIFNYCYRARQENLAYVVYDVDGTQIC